MKTNFKRILSLILVTFFIFTAAVPVLAKVADKVVSTDTTTGMRMQPLKDKYNSLTPTDLTNQAAKFSDVPKHWGKDYVAKLSSLEIINGYPNGKFGVNDTLLGGQYVLILMRTIGYKLDVEAGSPFYKPYVDVALKEGVLKTGEIKDYNKPITRELAVSMARRALGLYEEIPTDYFVKGVDYEGKGNYGFFDNVYVGYQKLKMTDWTTITSKYLQDIIDCYRMGIVGGSNNKFTPKGNLTRAEAAVIVVKLLDSKGRVPNVPNEFVKLTNPLSSGTAEGYCSDEYLYYEGKEYTFYRGYFPLMEIWDTVSVMSKNLNKIVGGAYNFGINEGNKHLGLGWFISEQLKHDALFNNPMGTILPQNGVSVNTQNTKIPKGEPQSIYDNQMGYLYGVYGRDEQNYDKVLKPYVYELMKVWFGDEYPKAKALHDKYLKLALNSEPAQYNMYLINGRQVHFVGGHGEGGSILTIEVWAKGVLNEQTMFHYK